MAKNRITVDVDMCKGCLLCANVCPQKILAQAKSHVNAKGYNPIQCTDPDACTACAFCARMCPDSVIKVERDVA